MRLILFLSLIHSSLFAQYSWINEFHYDNAGTDSLEFVEIADCGILTDLRVFLYNGSTGLPYDSVMLDSLAFEMHDRCRFFTWYPSLMQNGPSDGICLSQEDSLLETLAYEGAFTGVAGIASGVMFPSVSPREGSETSTTQSIQRDGRGNRPAHFKWVLGNQESRGKVNENQQLTDQPVVYLSSSDTLIFDTTPYGYHSAAQRVVLRGANLSTPVTLYPPEGFELDTTEYFTTRAVFGSSMTIPLTEDYIAPELLYIRFRPATADGLIVTRNLSIDQSEVPLISLPLRATEGYYNYPRMWINEFHYDDHSYDTLEFVEVAIQHPLRYDPNDISLQLYDGLTGRVYRSFNLADAWQSDYADPVWGLYVFDTPQLQNGPDGIALCYRDSCARFISYEGIVTATEGPAFGLTSIEIPEMEFPDTPESSSLQLYGSGKFPEDFTWAFVPAGETRGWPNGEQVLPLKLIDHNMTVSESSVVLTWKMAGEQDISGYLITKTRDGTTYDSIGWVNASGDPVYSFSYDTGHMHYVRVIAEDFTGKQVILFTYRVKREEEILWNISSNGKLYSPFNNAPVTIALISPIGQTLALFKGEIRDHALDLAPWLNNFATGLYILRVRTPMQIVSLRARVSR